MAWEFLYEPHWVEYARNRFSDVKGDFIRRNITQSIEGYFYESGGLSRSEKFQYHGYYFLQGQAAINQQDAWFGFVNTHRWLGRASYNRGYDMELVIAYRRHKEYRLDGRQFEGQFICIPADDKIVGIPGVNGQVAWIVDFDETWDQETWKNLFEEVRKIGW